MDKIKDRNNSKLVLVTGATGYIAAHLIKLLLENGHKVRGTVRSLAQKKRYEGLYELVPSKKENLSFVECDLMEEKGWDEAVKGVDWIAHLASPFLIGTPKDPEKELLLPAVNGVKFVLNAAIRNNVKRVVLTSSTAAIAYGANSYKKTHFNESDWSENAPRFYDQSKYLAEKEAWKIVEENKGKLDLTTICPTVVIGKVLLDNHCASMDTVKELWSMPALPRLKLGLVDVEDVALAHYRAYLMSDKTIGKRYLISAETLTFEQISQAFRTEFGKYGYYFAKYHICKCFFIAFKYFDKENLKLAAYWGIDLIYDNTNSKQDLQIEYRSWKKALCEMTYDMIEKGHLKNKIGKKNK